MKLEEMNKAIEVCYSKKPLGLTIRTEEDFETIKKIAAVLKEHKKPLRIRKMKQLLEMTGTILEEAMLENINL